LAITREASLPHTNTEEEKQGKFGGMFGAREEEKTHTSNINRKGDRAPGPMKGNDIGTPGGRSWDSLLGERKSTSTKKPKNEDKGSAGKGA